MPAIRFIFDCFVIVSDRRMKKTAFFQEKTIGFGNFFGKKIAVLSSRYGIMSIKTLGALPPYEGMILMNVRQTLAVRYLGHDVPASE